MKISEFLRSINELTGLESQELEALAGAGDIQALQVDIDDKIKESLEAKMKSFLTIESAKNNPDIQNHYKKQLFPSIKGELLGNVDSALMAYAKEVLNEDEYKKMEEAEFTKEKVNILKEGTHRILQEKNPDEEIKKVVESYKKQLSKAEQDRQAEINAIKEQTSKEKQTFIDSLIKKEFVRNINEKYEFAEAYKDPIVYNGIINNAFAQATKKAKITLDDELSNLTLKNLENPEMPFYITGTKEGTLDDIVVPHIKQFLKKSDANKPGQQARDNGHSQSVTTDTTIPPMLLDRMRMAQNEEDGF